MVFRSGVKEGLKSAAQQKSAKILKDALKDGGAGNYRLILPVAREKGSDSWDIVMARTVVATVTTVSKKGKPRYNRVVYTEKDLEPLSPSGEGKLVDISALTKYRRLGKVLRDGQYHVELDTETKKADTLIQNGAITEDEKKTTISNIEHKYHYDKDFRDEFIGDIIGYPYWCSAATGLLVKLDQNGKTVVDEKGNIDSATITSVYQQFSPSRLKELKGVLTDANNITLLQLEDMVIPAWKLPDGTEVPEQVLERAILEFSIVSDGGDMKQVMKSLKYNPVQQASRSINTKEQLDKMGVDITWEVETIAARAKLERGWDIKRTVDELKAYYSTESYAFMNVDVESEAFKWAAKDICEFDVYTKMTNKTFIDKAKEILGEQGGNETGEAPINEEAEKALQDKGVDAALSEMDDLSSL